jgi:hypothetical protein
VSTAWEPLRQEIFISAKKKKYIYIYMTLEVGIAKSEYTFLARGRLGKHIIAATNKEACSSGTVNTPSEQ